MRVYMHTCANMTPEMAWDQCPHNSTEHTKHSNLSFRIIVH